MVDMIICELDKEVLIYWYKIWNFVLNSRYAVAPAFDNESVVLCPIQIWTFNLTSATIFFSSVFRYESLHLSLRYAHLSQKSRYSFPVYIHHSAGLALVRSIFLFAHLCCLVMRIFVYDTPFFRYVPLLVQHWYSLIRPISASDMSFSACTHCRALQWFLYQPL